MRHAQVKAFIACAAISLTSPVLMAQVDLPVTVKVKNGEVEPVCNTDVPEWRGAKTVAGINIQEDQSCTPDNPAVVASVVKGTNNIPMDILMETRLAADAVIKKNDVDGDGDPDHIIIKLEVVELNGHSPDFEGYVPTFDIAPGVQPGMWVFAPKTRGMATRSFASNEASPLLRAPSVPIRVEQGDRVWIQLENTHYFPHTIHLHGVDHPWSDGGGEGNDGVPQTSDKFIRPGESRTYEIQPRQTGTMVYHCHVQTHTHLAMGLVGMFVIEENRPNNWVQTFNVGGGRVRHPSKAVSEKYDQEYDLHYHAMDKQLHSIIQESNDPRLIARKMNREYDMGDSTEDYHTLNGRSFPYTLRESLIIVEPDQDVKIRMFNSQGELLAIHTHGHKATMTHYDGIEHNPTAQITRDIYDLAPAQRVDLKLSTVDDGLHNYGEGIWIFHDHREKGILTDGQNPGGNVSAIVYKSFLGKDGIPKMQGIDVAPLFTKEFHARKAPVWQDIDEWNSLGEPTMDGMTLSVADTSAGSVAVKADQSDRGGGFAVRNFIVGLLLGLLAFYLFTHRQQLMAMVSKDKGEKDDA